jgi:hypothetical protein
MVMVELAGCGHVNVASRLLETCGFHLIAAEEWIHIYMAELQRYKSNKSIKALPPFLLRFGYRSAPEMITNVVRSYIKLGRGDIAIEFMFSLKTSGVNMSVIINEAVATRNEPLIQRIEAVLGIKRCPICELFANGTLANLGYGSEESLMLADDENEWPMCPHNK